MTSAYRMTRLLFPVALLLIAAGCGGPIHLEKATGREYTLRHPGASVNSPTDDFAPQLSPDGATLFLTSKRVTPVEDNEYDKLFIARRGEDGWSNAERLNTGQRGELREGSVCFDADRGELYFAQCYRPDGLGECDIYRASYDSTGWHGARNLGPPVNSVEWDCHPSVSRDGSALYFASERHGGHGGSDVWVASRRGDGSWGAPVNLGETVNTPGDEKTPFIAEDGVTLYFASNEYPGYGGYDIFKTVRGAKGWSAPVNVGRPINSTEDDLFFVATVSRDTMMVTSNRAGSLGGFDVFEIIREPEPPPPPKAEPLIVQVTVRNAFTLKPLDAIVTFTEAGGEELTHRAGADGMVRQEIAPLREIAVTASHPGFLSAAETFFYPANETGLRERQMLLTPYSEDEKKIYAFTVEFDFDFFNIRPEEEKHLDSAAVLLTQFPNSTVIVSGHTDSLGTDAYNLTLGYNRAREVSEYVARYLLEHQVRLQRPVEVRTYGESQPVASNETEEGRQRNRRVEIAIVRHE
jgi:outer membrane protein OmpA-like peptidoglycan-associated protein